MCAIAGMIGEVAGRAVVERMTERMRHRGPDDHGLWEAPGVVLGHRRLSIIDLSPASHQPMTLGDFTIVYNGEIYNYRELRRELKGPFVSQGDTEVILHLYARDGERCVDRLHGMFAFAIWDARRRALFAARDRLGIKPFFYAELRGGLAFASELKALLELGHREVDRSALVDYFSYKYVPAPKTIYAGIAKLLPAHTLVYDGKVATRRYWSVEPSTTITDPAVALEKLSPLLRDCISSHMVADVPVGVFLSGGIDSTCVVAHLERPKTFTVGFDVEDHSEIEHARLVARHFGADHREETVEVGDIEEVLAALPGMYDEPFGDTAAWPTFICSRTARREVTAALSGEGGDEVFSGYGWYGKWLELGSSPAAWLLSRLMPRFSGWRRSLALRGVDELERYAMLVGLFTVPQKRALLAPDLWDPEYDHFWPIRRFWRPDLDPVKRMQWVDLNTWLPDDLLVKVDRASMAVSLEVRPPLLDHRLVEFALSLDSALLRQGGRGKLLLRRVLDGRVPAEVLTRPKKGFGMPIRRWMRNRPELIDEAFRRLAAAGILRSARRPRLEGQQVWALLVLDRWVSHARHA